MKPAHPVRALPSLLAMLYQVAVNCPFQLIMELGQYRVGLRQNVDNKRRGDASLRVNPLINENPESQLANQTAFVTTLN